MKLLKQSITCFVAFFIISGAALAGTVAFTGTGYLTTNIEVSATSDGRNLQNYTNSGFWVQEGLPEGFPSTLVADCQGVALSTAEWASLGDTFICVATDIDGDGFINAGGSTQPDYSDCHAKTVAAWGKYADVTTSVKCKFAGPVTPNAIMLTWTGEFTTP
tara:strand:- start:15 stop:497 length:483 start_codon:yes stop_codon:yes gene_type:complete